MDREAPREVKSGISSMPVGETVSLAALGKWLVGLVLAPWLWYERKRVDKIIESLRDKHYTKDEVKEKIDDKLEPMKRDISWIRQHLENK
jgi:hypothetical protein